MTFGGTGVPTASPARDRADAGNHVATKTEGFLSADWALISQSGLGKLPAVLPHTPTKHTRLFVYQ